VATILCAAPLSAPPAIAPDEINAMIASIMEDMAAEPGATYQQIASLYQDFTCAAG
jgi:hypothetical protein